MTKMPHLTEAENAAANRQIADSAFIHDYDGDFRQVSINPQGMKNVLFTILQRLDRLEQGGK